jgi:hypothetical protein
MMRRGGDVKFFKSSITFFSLLTSAKESTPSFPILLSHRFNVTKHLFLANACAINLQPTSLMELPRNEIFFNGDWSGQVAAVEEEPPPPPFPDDGSSEVDGAELPEVGS